MGFINTGFFILTGSRSGEFPLLVGFRSDGPKSFHQLVNNQAQLKAWIASTGPRQSVRTWVCLIKSWFLYNWSYKPHLEVWTQPS